MILHTAVHTSGIVPHALARMAGLPVEPRWVAVRRGEHRQPAFLAVNPKGEVPVLLRDDGEAITEIPAIVLALEEMAPGAGLLPRAGLPRLRAVERLCWLHYRMANTFQMPVVAERYAGGDVAAAAAIRAAAPERVAQTFALAEAGLAGAGEEGPVTADLVFLAVLARFAKGGGTDLSPYPALNRLARRVVTHPPVRAALEEEAAEIARAEAAA